MRSSLRQRDLGIIGIAAVVLLAPVLTAVAQPSGDSEFNKYPKRTSAQAKPEPPREPDPKMDCPWLPHVIDDRPVMDPKENKEEVDAYNYFVLHARKFSLDVMAKHTRKELTFPRLFEDGHKYRGEIVRVEGRLKRLTWIGSNKQLEGQGVKSLYEAWIFGEHYFSNPTCVIVSELPAGIEPGEDIRDVHVAVDGYYFKRYVYETPERTAENRPVNRRAPLVIARTLTRTDVVGQESPGARAFGRLFLPVVIGLLLAMVGAVLLIHRWFRAGDRHSQNALRHARGDEFIAPIEQPHAPAPRVMPDGPSWN